MRLSVLAEDAILDSIRELLARASLRFYDLTPPSSPEAKLTVQQHLASLTFAEATLADGQIRASLEQGTALASGRATWARCFRRDGSVIFDCDVGETGDGVPITLNTADLRKGGPVTIRSFSLGITR